jgi:hypothetical protein
LPTLSHILPFFPGRKCVYDPRQEFLQWIFICSDVTCGGLELSEVNLDSFESKKYPGLYFTGEVLNIDGITGGFNFQSCWSSAWVISEKIRD